MPSWLNFLFPIATPKAFSQISCFRCCWFVPVSPENLSWFNSCCFVFFFFFAFNKNNLKANLFVHDVRARLSFTFVICYCNNFQKKKKNKFESRDVGRYEWKKKRSNFFLQKLELDISKISLIIIFITAEILKETKKFELRVWKEKKME